MTHHSSRPSSGGVTYIRWGRKVCPSVPGTELVYEGIAAGSYFAHRGGSSTYLCLPAQPEYSSFASGIGLSSCHGAEYRTGITDGNLVDKNVPCAVCHASTRSAVLMVPARNTCPPSWTHEYSGYLMSDIFTHHRTTYECVDSDAEPVPGRSTESDGAFFYHVEVTCNGIPCPPYDPEKELTCTVCTK